MIFFFLLKVLFAKNRINRFFFFFVQIPTIKKKKKTLYVENAVTVISVSSRTVNVIVFMNVELKK